MIGTTTGHLDQLGLFAGAIRVWALHSLFCLTACGKESNGERSRRNKWP